MTAEDFLGKGGDQQVITAIRKAETRTSGEIRVHLEQKCDGEPRKRAEQIFHELKMDNTRLQNGVLIYVAVDSHKFVILGDKGINREVGEKFWEEVRDAMQYRFRESEFTQGLIEGITLAAEKLAEYFPWQEDDINELPDEITTG